jgi:hypothetical protein
MSTFEAAKFGAVPGRFTDLEAAVNYIAGSPTRDNEVRPWIRNVDTNAFVVIGGRVQLPKGGPR